MAEPEALYQKPHPPLRVAATSEETYPMVGRLGCPLVVAVRAGSISDLSRFLGGYLEVWRWPGTPGRRRRACRPRVRIEDGAAGPRGAGGEYHALVPLDPSSC
jgi:hypothetical protein